MIIFGVSVISGLCFGVQDPKVREVGVGSAVAMSHFGPSICLLAMFRFGVC